MAAGNLGLFRRVEQSFWLEVEGKTIQVKLREIGGKGFNSWARLIISAPEEVRIHREAEWIGSDSPMRRTRPKCPQSAIMSALELAANAWRPGDDGRERLDMHMVGDISKALMGDLENMGFAVNRRPGGAV